MKHWNIQLSVSTTTPPPTLLAPTGPPWSTLASSPFRIDNFRSSDSSRRSVICNGECVRREACLVLCDYIVLAPPPATRRPHNSGSDVAVWLQVQGHSARTQSSVASRPRGRRRCLACRLRLLRPRLTVSPQHHSPLPTSPPAARRGGPFVCCFQQERAPGCLIENLVGVRLYLWPFLSCLRLQLRPHPVGRKGSTAAGAVEYPAGLLVQGTGRFLTSKKAPFRFLAGGRRRQLLPLVGVLAAASAALRATYLIFS